jgi:hypothetical protein
MIMPEYEYEVRFIIGGVNITTIVYVDDENVGEGDGYDYPTIEDKAQNYGAVKVFEDTGWDVSGEVFDEVECLHTGTIGGN